MKALIYVVFFGACTGLIFGTQEAGAKTIRNKIANRCLEVFSHFRSHRAKQEDRLSAQRALLRSPQLVFGDNFRKEDLEGDKAYFVVKQMSLNSRKPLGRIIKKTRSQSAIAEIIDPTSGTLHEINILLDQQKNGSFYLTSPGNRLFTGTVLQGRPDMELIFSAIKSERKELAYQDMSFHPKEGNTLRAQALKNEGYSPAYRKHIDEVNQWHSLQQQFQETGVNPYKTHIEYLAKPLAVYINYIKQGVELLPDLEIQSAIIKQGTRPPSVMQFKKETGNRLTELEKRVEKAIKEKRLTYQQFLKFIIELSQAVRYSTYISNIQPDQLNALLEYFPLIIAVPVKGEVGIIALNESVPVGVYPLGLSYQIKTVDGRSNLLPVEFTRHDINHALLSMKSIVVSLYTASKQFHDRLMKYRKSLPIEERKNVDLAYYILTHEDFSLAFVTKTSEEIQKTIQRMLTNQIQRGHNFRGLKDFSKERKEEQIFAVAHDFTKAFKTITEDLGFRLQEGS